MKTSYAFAYAMALATEAVITNRARPVKNALALVGARRVSDLRGEVTTATAFSVILSDELAVQP